MKGIKEKGFAIMLLSLILLIGFNIVGWKYVFDLSLHWATIWMLLGVIGFFMTFFDKHKKPTDTDKG